MDERLLKKITSAQKNEITEHIVYGRLARAVKNSENIKTLGKIAADELAHYNFWKKYTGKDIGHNKWKVWKYFWIAKVLGITFGVKLMEKEESNAQDVYEKICADIPETRKIIDDEERHEKDLINLIEEDKLKYVGSIVLGLNDALVELTGTLAGLSLALQNTRLIALAGLVTGIAAALSMAVSEYLSQKEEGQEKTALRASVYTGIAYILTVMFLILPYLLLQNYMYCLLFTLANAVFVIFVFSYYVSVAKDVPFRKRFLEMTTISLTVACISFFIGYLLKRFIGVGI